MPTPYLVQLDPPAVAISRQMLDLNTGPIRVDQAGIDWGDAAIQAYLADQQRWGSVPVSYRVPNRTVTIPLGVGMDESGTFEQAKAALEQKVARFQDEGGWLLRQRANGGAPLYADIVDAALTFPDMLGETGGLETSVRLTLTCLPDFYGDLVTLDTVNAAGETQTVLQQGGQQAVILGDYPGRAQVTVLEGSGNQQFGLLWSFRARNYSPAASAGLVWPAAASLTPAAGAVISALSGARGGQVIQQAVTGAWTTICQGTGSHIGSYAMKARVYSGASGVMFRLVWAVGDMAGSVVSNDPIAVPAAGGFYLLDLGQVRVDPIPVGTQQWQWQIQAYQPSGATSQASVDMAYLQPVDESSSQLEGVSPSNPLLISGGRLQLRFDSAYRQSSSGAYTPVAKQFGDLPRIPASGYEQRPVQLFAKPSRGDFGSMADPASQDAFSVIVAYRPSYLLRP